MKKNMEEDNSYMMDETEEDLIGDSETIKSNSDIGLDEELDLNDDINEDDDNQEIEDDDNQEIEEDDDNQGIEEDDDNQGIEEGEDNQDIEDNTMFSYDPDNFIVKEENHSKIKIINKKDRKSCPFLTKYEITRIIAIRASQIDEGVPLLIQTNVLLTSIETAIMELILKKTPFKIRRPICRNVYEEWDISELDILDKNIFEDILKEYKHEIN